MAKSRASHRSNGNGRLDEALRNLIQAQATLVAVQAAQAQNLAAFQGEMAEMRRELADFRRQVWDRFARVEAILNEHTRILERLPEAVREKIGFKPSQ